MRIFKKNTLIGIAGVLLCFVALLYFSINPANQIWFPKCPIHESFGIYCSGCGSQRAIHDLLHLRIGEAFSHNMLMIPAFILIGIEFTMRIGYPKRQSLFYYTKTPIVLLVVILLFTVLRNINAYPFTLLAP